MQIILALARIIALLIVAWTVAILAMVATSAVRSYLARRRFYDR